MSTHYLNKLNKEGFCQIPWQQDIYLWSQALLPHAKAAMQESRHAHWWRYQHTWFVGVNVLNNDSKGRIAVKDQMTLGLPSWLDKLLGQHSGMDSVTLEPAQVSACTPGYPKINTDKSLPDSDKAHWFRKRHYAAHVDGLIPIGKNKRRFLQEQHSFILGIPLTQHDKEAGPLMIWPKSHQRIQMWLQNQLKHLAPEQWAQEDLTDSYHTIRKQILQDTMPQALPATAGEAYIVHRHLLHGQGLWPESLQSPTKERIIAYFRPAITSPLPWLYN